MKKLLIVVLCLFFLVGCGTVKKSGASIAKVKSITCEEAHKLSKEANVYLIDVRTKEEFESSHLENAINIPVDNIRSITNNNIVKLNDIIIVYCRSGNRSKTSADELIKMGFTNVYDLGAITKCQ